MHFISEQEYLHVKFYNNSPAYNWIIVIISRYDCGLVLTQRKPPTMQHSPRQTLNILSPSSPIPPANTLAYYSNICSNLLDKYGFVLQLNKHWNATNTLPDPEQIQDIVFWPSALNYHSIGQIPNDNDRVAGENERFIAGVTFLSLAPVAQGQGKLLNVEPVAGHPLVGALHNFTRFCSAAEDISLFSFLKYLKREFNI